MDRMPSIQSRGPSAFSALSARGPRIAEHFEVERLCGTRQAFSASSDSTDPSVALLGRAGASSQSCNGPGASARRLCREAHPLGRRWRARGNAAIGGGPAAPGRGRPLNVPPAAAANRHFFHLSYLSLAAYEPRRSTPGPDPPPRQRLDQLPSAPGRLTFQLSMRPMRHDSRTGAPFGPLQCGETSLRGRRSSPPGVSPPPVV